VPTGRELAPSPDTLSLIEFAEIPFFMSLPFVAPPGVPADRVKALQDAFMAMCRDPGVLDEAAKLGIDMSPINAEQILQLVEPGLVDGRDRHPGVAGRDVAGVGG